MSGRPKRWEASEGLPIHRQRHAARSSVYAFPAEIDTWRAGRWTEPKHSAAAPPPSAVRRTLALAFTLLVAVVTTGSGRAATTRAIEPDAQETFRKVWTAAAESPATAAAWRRSISRATWCGVTFGQASHAL
jgi:hypothetical protein